MNFFKSAGKKAAELLGTEFSNATGRAEKKAKASWGTQKDQEDFDE